MIAATPPRLTLPDLGCFETRNTHELIEAHGPNARQMRLPVL
jgi:hypothetical protein